MISTLEIDGRLRLFFDTGLGAQAFAQAKLSYFVMEHGFIVSRDGEMSVWQAEGAVERNGTIGLWGPAFEGRPLDVILEAAASGGDANGAVSGAGVFDAAKDVALDALRAWIAACISLSYRGVTFSLAPALALVASDGTLLFYPPTTARRSLEAENCWISGGERWIHPDLRGEEAIAFTASALLYQLFVGMPPFLNTDLEVLHQDMREGVYLPIHLAVSGLNAELVALVKSALMPTKDAQGAVPHSLPRAVQHTVQPSVQHTQRAKLATQLRDFLGDFGSKKADLYIQICTEEERTRIGLEREKFLKKSGLTVKTKRFVARNTSILAVCLAALISVGLIVRSTIESRASLPTTRGMATAEVVETYYGAFATLDHQLMEACVQKNTSKIGKGDIEMVTNLFVLNRVQQAYEYVDMMVSAQEWVDAGSPPTDLTVFGVSGLQLEVLDSDESDGETTFRASYTLWLPGSYRPLEEGEETPDPFASDGAVPPPWGVSYTDTLRLSWYKDAAWRITDITREGDARLY
ncbi:MAG: hypothetical protein LBJ41_05015 [Treponema sp.]|jgi:hypothetical protein|nr:hypothetical protein [Treponema sp.]